MAERVPVTRMRVTHLDDVLAIERRVYPRPWSGSLFLAELNLWQDRGYWVALVDGALAGYGGVMMSGDDGHITTVAVDPDRQGNGIGTRLVRVLCEDAIDRAAQSLTLEVRTTNRRAQDLYRRFGFAPVGIRKNYYEGTEDAVIMWVHDVGSAEYRTVLDDAVADINPPFEVLDPKPWAAALT